MFIVTIAFGLLALFFLNLARAESTRASKPVRSSLKDFIQMKKKSMDVQLHNSKLHQQFKEAGNPLGLTGLSYQYLRFGLLFLYFLVKLPGFLAAPELKTLMGILFWVGFLYVMSMPGEYLPITRILLSVKNYNTAEKNRELFMLYSLIADETISGKNDRMNLLAVLKEMREYTNLIRPAIDRSLLNWNKGTAAAMQIMAIEIGTTEADELTKILADIEETDSEKAIKLLADRQETFLGNQKENKRRKLKTTFQYAYVVAFLPLIIYLWNMMYLIMMEVEFITDFTNLR